MKTNTLGHIEYILYGFVVLVYHIVSMDFKAPLTNINVVVDDDDEIVRREVKEK